MHAITKRKSYQVTMEQKNEKMDKIRQRYGAQFPVSKYGN